MKDRKWRLNMYHGILPIWKEAGMTSHDVVFKVRKLLKMKKIGHTGTLDPSVSGVLVLCLGQGTKLVELLMDGRKGYRGEVTLGQATETEDADGAVVSQVFVNSPVDTATIDTTMRNMQGWIQQIPPMYSAVKVNGRRLYEYARSGEQVERPIRDAFIECFKRTSEPTYDAVNGVQKWEFDVLCGKGTYVRTLAVDLGETLGYPSHMSKLERYMSGGFTQDHAITLKQLEEIVAYGDVTKWIHPIEQALSEMPQLHLLEDQLFVVKNGQVVADDYFNEDVTEATALYWENRVIAIYAPHPTKKHALKPIRMFQYE